MRYLCLSIAAMLCFLSLPQQAKASPLLGLWTENGGPGAARMAPCSDAPQRLCATGYDGLPNGTIGRKGAVVLRDLKPDGQKRWRGTYLDGGRTLPATVKLVANGKVTMRVCLVVLCQTVTYTRVGE